MTTRRPGSKSRAGGDLRAAAFVVLMCGVGVGAWADVLPARAAFRAGPYRILAGDFHVHGFPGDGGLPSWSLRDEARRAGIDVFAVTNHNQMLTNRLAQWIAARSDGPIMIAGEEVTSGEYHLIALGVTMPVRADQSADRAIAAIHRQGGVAIAAHPGNVFHGWTDAAVATLDGTEVAHPAILQGEAQRQELLAFRARALQSNPRVAPIGSSDVHMTATLGICRTFVFVKEVSADAVLEALRTGMTVATDPQERLYGRPELVRLLQERRPVARLDAHPQARRLSIGLTFLGVVGVLLLGGSRMSPASHDR